MAEDNPIEGIDYSQSAFQPVLESMDQSTPEDPSRTTTTTTMYISGDPAAIDQAAINQVAIDPMAVAFEELYKAFNPKQIAEDYQLQLRTRVEEILKDPSISSIKNDENKLRKVRDILAKEDPTGEWRDERFDDKVNLTKRFPDLFPNYADYASSIEKRISEGETPDMLIGDNTIGKYGQKTFGYLWDVSGYGRENVDKYGKDLKWRENVFNIATGDEFNVKELEVYGNIDQIKKEIPEIAGNIEYQTVQEAIQGDPSIDELNKLKKSNPSQALIIDRKIKVKEDDSKEVKPYTGYAQYDIDEEAPLEDKGDVSSLDFLEKSVEGRYSYEGFGDYEDLDSSDNVFFGLDERDGLSLKYSKDPFQRAGDIHKQRDGQKDLLESINKSVSSAGGMAIPIEDLTEVYVYGEDLNLDLEGNIREEYKDIDNLAWEIQSSMINPKGVFENLPESFYKRHGTTKSQEVNKRNMILEFADRPLDLLDGTYTPDQIDEMWEATQERFKNRVGEDELELFYFITGATKPTDYYDDSYRDGYRSSNPDIKNAIVVDDETETVDRLRGLFSGTSFRFKEAAEGYDAIEIYTVVEDEFGEEQILNSSGTIFIDDENNYNKIVTWMAKANPTATDKRLISERILPEDSKLARGKLGYTDKEKLFVAMYMMENSERFDIGGGEAIVNLEAVKTYTDDLLQNAWMSDDLLDRVGALIEYSAGIDYLRESKKESSLPSVALSGFLTGIMRPVKYTANLMTLGATSLASDDMLGRGFDKYAYDLQGNKRSTSKAKDMRVKEITRDNLRNFENISKEATGVQKEWLNENAPLMHKVVGFVAESLGVSMWGGTVSSTRLASVPVVGGVLGEFSPAFFMMMSDHKEDEMLGREFDGLSEWDKKKISVPYGFVMGQLEKVGFEAGIGAFSNNTFGKFTRVVINDALKNIPKNASKEVIETAIKNSFKAKAIDFGLRFTGGSVSEGFVESVQSVSDVATNKIINGITGLEYFKELPDLTTVDGWIKMGKAAGEEGFYGMLGGGLTSAGSISFGVVRDGVLNVKGNKEFKEYYDIVSNEDMLSSAKNMVLLRLQQNMITKQQADAEIDALDKSYSVSTEIPTDLTTNQKRQSYELLMERRRIEQEIEGKDKSLTARQTERLSDINSQLELISKGGYKDAIQKQKTDEEVLPAEQPEVGLQEVDARDEAVVEQEETTDEEALKSIQEENKVRERYNEKPIPEDIEKRKKELDKEKKALREQGMASIEETKRKEGIAERKAEKDSKDPYKKAILEIEEKKREIGPETSSNYANLTEDEDGNIVFFRVGRPGHDNLKPKSGETTATSKEERAALSKVGGMVMLYTQESDGESMITGDTKYAVKVKKSKVYDFNSDPDNFIKEARERHDKENPGMAFDPNSQVAYVAQVAAENGYEVVVSEWAGRTRAQSVNELQISDVQTKDGNRITKKFKGKYESNKDKGYESVIPADKDDQLEEVYKKIKNEKSDKKEHDEVYFLFDSRSRKKNYSQDQITKMVNESNISQETKDEYNAIMEAKPEQRRSEKVRDNIAGVDIKYPTKQEEQQRKDERTKPEYVDNAAKQNQEEDVESFQKELEGEFGMLTGENPLGKPLTEQENQQLNKKAEQWLKKKGYKPRRVTGKYGQAENSFFVPGLTKKDAIAFAKEFKQESVAHSDGMIFQDGSMNPRKKSNDNFAMDQHSPESDMVSVINTKDGLKTFVVGYDFKNATEAIPSPKKRPTTKTVKEKVNRILDQVEKAKKSISKVIPDVEIVVHKDESAYRKATGETDSKKQASRGEYNPKTKKIHINLSKANNRTVAHEVFHAILIERLKTDKAARDLTERMIKSLSNKLEGMPEVKEALDKFAANYDENIQNEEKLAELIGILAENYGQMDKANKSLIKRFLDRLAKMFGLKPFTDNEVVDVLNTIAGKVSVGEEISDVDVKVLSEGASTFITEPTTILSKKQIGKKVKAESKPSELSFVTKKDLIDIESLVKEIADKKQKVWFWVADQMGRGMYSDVVIDGEHFLDAGPSYALDPVNKSKDIIWATGKDKSEIEKLIGQSDFIFIISGSPITSKLFNKKNIDILEERVGDYSKFKKDLLKSKPTKPIRDILNKHNSWNSLKESPDRKKLLIAFENQKDKNTTAKKVLSKYNAFIDFNSLRDGFYKENDFKMNEVMLVLKPTAYGGKSNHSTYENDILGEVIGVPDAKVDSFDLMPEAIRKKYSETLSATQKTQVVAPYGIGVKEIESPSKRKQAIGENAHLSREVTSNLSRAKAMSNMKKTPKEIRLATGWEKGIDGKWRYEILDIEFKDKFKDEFQFPYKKLKKIPSGAYIAKLSEMFDGNELFKAYDSKLRKKLPMYFDDGTRWEGADYNKNFNPLKDITVYFRPRSGPFGEYDPTFNNITVYLQPGNFTNEEVRNTIIHEIQHYIQEREGFQTGTNLEDGRTIDEYDRTAGEVEAKNMEKRANMTADERRDKTLADTENVAREDQILVDIDDKFIVPSKRKQVDNVPSIIYHVTFQENNKSVKEKGLLKNKIPTFARGMTGTDLFETQGLTFAFSNLEEATKWGIKMEIEKEKAVSIVTIDTKGKTWEEDTALTNDWFNPLSTAIFTSDEIGPQDVISVDNVTYKAGGKPFDKDGNPFTEKSIDTPSKRKQLVAPNGKPSNLNQEQYDLVRTPAFKNWFGDWEWLPINASMVVDENGEPLVMYHGMPHKFEGDAFKLDYKKSNRNVNHHGIYFTANKQTAERYAGKTGNITDVFLNIKNPYIQGVAPSEKGVKWFIKNFKEKRFFDDYWNEKLEQFKDRSSTSLLFSEDLTELAILEGYDGKFDGSFKHGDTVIFNVNQAKLADGSNKTFDPQDASIRKQKGDARKEGDRILINDIKKGDTIMPNGMYAAMQEPVEVEGIIEGQNSKGLLLTNGRITWMDSVEHIDRDDKGDLDWSTKHLKYTSKDKSEEYKAEERIVKDLMSLGKSNAPHIYHYHNVDEGKGRIDLRIEESYRADEEKKPMIDIIKDVEAALSKMKSKIEKPIATALDYGGVVTIRSFGGKSVMVKITVGNTGDVYHNEYEVHSGGRMDWNSSSGKTLRTSYDVSVSSVVSGIKKFAIEYRTVPFDTKQLELDAKQKRQANKNKAAQKSISDAEAAKLRRIAPRFDPIVANVFNKGANAYVLEKVYPQDSIWYPLIKELSNYKGSIGEIKLGWDTKANRVRGWDGHYSSSKGEIMVNKRSFHPESTIAHEYVHGVTSRAIDDTFMYLGTGEQYINNLKEKIKELKKSGDKTNLALARIGDMYLYAAEKAGVMENLNRYANTDIKGYAYGWTNIHEFVAEALTNKDFQETLNSIKVDPKGPAVKSVFNRLVEIINDLIKSFGGEGIIKNSVLEEVIRQTSDVANAQNKWIFERNQEAKVQPSIRKQKGEGPVDSEQDEGPVEPEIDIRDLKKKSDKKIKETNKGKGNILRRLRRGLLDRQNDIKRIVKDFVPDPKKVSKIMNAIVTRAGASGYANEVFKQQDKKIFGGLSSEQINNLEAIIYARRIVAINENRRERGMEPYIGMEGIDEKGARDNLKMMQSILGVDGYIELSKRADLYFNEFKKNLKMLKDSGRITEEVYENLRDVEYSPIKTLKYIMPKDTVTDDDINRAVSTLGVNRKDIMKLSDINENEILFDARFLLMMNTNIVVRRSFENKMLNEFAEGYESMSEKDKGALSDFIKEGPLKKLPPGFRKVEYFKDGERREMIMREDYARQLLDIKNNNKWLKGLGKITGANVLRFFATGGNPLFIIGNTAVDFANIAFFSDVYSAIKPLAAVQLAYDYVKNFMRKAFNTESYNKIKMEFMEHGGAMDFLSTDGLRMVQEMKLKNKILNSAQKKLAAYARFMSYIGETGEMSFRVAVYEKVKKAEIKKFEKENGRSPNQQEMEDIMFEAAAQSRETIDFSQGGTWVKQMDLTMPYFNAAMQGLRRPIDFARKNPIGFASNVIQYALMTGGLAATSLATLLRGIGDDEEERKKIQDILNSISEYEKANYHIIFTGKKDKDGNYQYYRIKKLPLLSILGTITEQYTTEYLLNSQGIEYKADTKSIKKSMELSAPIDVLGPVVGDASVGESIGGIVSRNPLAASWLTYTYNKDTFTGQKVFYDQKDKKILPYAEGLYSDNVDDIYKVIAPAMGMSPARTKAAVEKIITSETTNPTIAIFYMITNGLFDTESDEFKENADTFDNGLNHFLETVEKKYKRYTNPNILRYRDEDKLNELEEKIDTDEYLKKVKIKKEIDKYVDSKIISEGDWESEEYQKELNKLQNILNEYEVFEKDKSYYGSYTARKDLKGNEVFKEMSDIIYERDPKMMSVRLYSRYGNNLDEDELKELKKNFTLSKVGNTVLKEGYQIYYKKYYLNKTQEQIDKFEDTFGKIR